ncbi:MAG: hypothetical protein JWL98_276 [Xanthomonadaceae bacterium]|nr:hypothetical protein [Xanthomonadaceae bacterium]
MSKLLLNLRMVLPDEADDVRAMLDANRIDFYETRPSRWGISYGGIWVAHDGDIAKAKSLMAQYQTERRTRVRAERDAALRDGSAETFATVLRRDPVRVVFTVLAILALLGVIALVPLLLARH